MIIKKHTAGGEKFKQRKFGDAPAIGNVPRASGEIPPNRQRRSARTSHKKKLSKHFFAWTILLCFVAICILLISLVKYSRFKAEQRANPASVSDKPGDFDLLFEENENAGLPDLTSDDAIGIVTKALANRDPNLIRDFFILGNDDSPEQAMEELIRISDADGEMSRIEWLGLRFSNGSTFVQVMVYTTIDVNEKARIAQFAPGSDGKWRIDLDAYLRKCVPPIEEVALGKSKTSLVRVFVVEDNFYHGMYYDETEWRVYALASPDITDLLYAYVKRGSSQHKALSRIIDTDEVLHRATLNIIKQPNSGPRQFEISRVVAENWIIGEKDFDESF